MTDDPLHLISKLTEDNEARRVALNRQLGGEEVGFNRVEMMLEALYDRAFPPHSPERDDIELAWQYRIATDLTKMEAQVRQGVILNGVRRDQ